MKSNKLNLANAHDEITWTRNSSKIKSNSIIDLTFISQNLENKLINWTINKDESTESDHEIIRFDLITSVQNVVSNPLSIKYNLTKAN